MALPTKHLVHQGQGLKALSEALVWSALSRLRKASPELPPLPGPEITVELPPRSPALVRDYIAHVGGDPAAYEGTIPAHMFHQWGLPLAFKTLRVAPYPIARLLNGGCRLEIHAPLPAGERLHARARLESMDVSERRALMRQRIITGTASAPDAVVAYLYAIVPLGQAASGSRSAKSQDNSAPAEASAQGSNADKKAKSKDHLVPEGARKLATWDLTVKSGQAFTMLVGDFNPIHWMPPYARAFGFQSTILHGFSTMARAIEGLQQGLFGGSAQRLATLDVQFARPLVLPAQVHLYVEEAADSGRIFVGDGPQSKAYMLGTFTAR